MPYACGIHTRTDSELSTTTVLLAAAALLVLLPLFFSFFSSSSSSSSSSTSSTSSAHPSFPLSSLSFPPSPPPLPPPHSAHHGHAQHLQQWPKHHKELPECRQFPCSNWPPGQLPHIWSMGCLHSSCPARQRLPARQRKGECPQGPKYWRYVQWPEFLNCFLPCPEPGCPRLAAA